MKHRNIRAISLVLAIILAMSPLASASEAMGHELYDSISRLGPGTTLTTGRLWSDSGSDLRTERYLTYTPNPDVTPTVTYGSVIPQRNTLTKMAKSLETGGKRVLGGSNGDYFVVATGAPLGLVITNGILRSSASYHYGIGFRADGTAFIGQPQIATVASFHGGSYGLGGVNKIRETTGGFFFFNSDFGATTQNSSAGVDVILRPLTTNVEVAQVDAAVEQRKAGEAAAKLAAEHQAAVDAAVAAGTEVPVFPPDPPFVPTVTIPTEQKDLNTVPVVGKQVAYVVEQVLQSTGDLAIPQGKVVLSINSKSDAAKVAALAALVPGDKVEIDTFSQDTRWNEAVSAMGGMYQIVKNGKVGSGWEVGSAPRTAVGVKADGSTVLYTMDGRQSGYSIGATITQVAMRLVELGCVDAICLDGGGSTSFGTTAAVENTFALNNSPSDGSQRAVTNALFFVSNLKATGTIGSLSLVPYSGLMLAGATLPLKSVAVDTGYFPLWPVSEVTYEAQGGTVTPEGVLTAGAAAGTATVTATLGTAQGQGTYTVVTTPTAISVKNQGDGSAVTSLNLDPGGTIDLAAVASYRSLPVTAQDQCFTWAVTPGLGTIDATGRFTAGAAGGAGAITVTAGSKTVSIPLSIASHILTLENFEGDFANIAGVDATTAAPEKTTAYVRFGLQSMRVAYDNAKDGSGKVMTPLPIAPGENFISLWAYGDGSSNTLSVSVTDTAGKKSELWLGVLDFTGWKQLTAPLPAGTVGLGTLSVTRKEGTQTAGTIWIDQMTTANRHLTDGNAPTVAVSATATKVTATVSDNVDRTIPQENVTLTLDGKAVPFRWDARSRKLTATLVATDGQPHRVTVTVTDASGNVGRGSADLKRTVTTPPPFADVAGHWAEDYTRFLWNRGISNGVITAAGTLFQPETSITRGEFFLMVARWIGVNPADYAGVVLPFADTAAIPAWSVNGVKAMYAMGVLQGSAENGKLYVNSEKSISRAEAMSILGRIQPRGYPTAGVVFTDRDSIPLWAMPHIQSLTAQKVVSGYQGALRPSDPLKRGEVAKLLYTLT